jgi:WD40 repeat protein
MLSHVDSAHPGNLDRPYMSPASPIRALAVVDDGSAYFTAPEDNTIRMYETDTRKRKWLGRHSGVRSLVLNTANGRQTLLSGGTDGHVLMWDFDGGIPSNRPREAAELRTDGAIEAIAFAANTIAVASDTGMVRSLDLARNIAGEARHDGVRCVDISATGRRVVSGGGDGTIMVWQRQRGKPTLVNTHILPGEMGGARSLLIIGENAVVVGTTSGAIVRWDWSTDEVLRFADEHTEPVWTLSQLSNGAGDAIISGSNDQTVRKWSINNGKQIGDPTRLDGAVYATAVPTGGQHPLWFAAGSDGQVHIHDHTGERQRPFVGHTDAVLAIAISDDEHDLVVTGSADRKALVWTQSGQRAEALTGHRREVTAVALWPADATKIVTGSTDGTAIIWERFQHTRIHTLEHGAPVWAVAVTPDGNRVITGGSGGSIKIWNADTGTTIGDPQRVERFAVSAITIAGNGSTAVIGGDSGEIAIWDLLEMRKLGDSISAAVGGVTSVSITEDGRLAAVGGADGIVSFWDIKSRERQSHIDTGHGSVTKVLLTQDGREVITCGADGTIKRWRRDTGAYVGWHHCDFTAAVMSIALSRTGDVIIAGGGQGQIDRVATEDFHTVSSASDDDKDDPRVDTQLQPLPGLASDGPSRVDRIGNTRDVRVLSELIAARGDNDSLSIALLGEWGSGKSSMIHQVFRLVYELASANRPGGSHDPFVRQVRQVRFNAWHYSDDQLWTGLVERLFHGINAEPAAEDHDSRDATPTAEELHARKEKQTQLRLRRAALVSRQETLEESLRVASTTAAALPIIAELQRARHLGAALVNMITTYRHALRHTGTDKGGEAKILKQHLNKHRRRRAYIIGVPLLSLVALAAQRTFLPDVMNWLWGGIVTAATLLTAAMGWVTLGRKRLEQANNTADEALAGEVARLTSELDVSTKELNKVDPAFRLEQLLRKLHQPERYQRFRGVIGYVYQDLNELDEALRAAAAEAENSSLERIVLYIDDLDRCSPDRIMAVVQAVNLLTTFAMFVVVVPMDLVGLRGMLPGKEEPASALLPLELLEKVFHVAYAIRPLGHRGHRFVSHLFEEVQRDFAVAPQPEGPEDRQTPREPTPAPPPPPGPVPAPSATTPTDNGRAPADLPADGRSLAITDSEVALLGFLGTRLRSPRAVKKLTNLYRMVLVSEHDRRHEFLAGECEAVAILLAGLVSCPATFGKLIDVLCGTAAECDHNRAMHYRVLDTLQSAGKAGEMVVELFTAHGEWTDRSLHDCLSTYRRWAVKVARYGFETYTRYTG